MSDDGFVAVLLPGTTTDPGAVAETVASVAREVGREGSVVRCAGLPCPLGGGTDDGIPVVDPEALLEEATIVSFARVGDRWIPGTLAARRRPLLAHPTAVLSVAGHRRTTADGTAVLDVPAPLPPLDPASLLLRPCVEASSVLVAAGALDGTALELLHRPHGDAVVWAHLIGKHGHLPSGEIASEVRLDPNRHAFRAPARTEAMLAAVAAPDGDDDPVGMSEVRRELLRQMFVVADDRAEVELSAWLGATANASARARAVVEDLRWALDRQRDALIAERVRWWPEKLGDGGTVPGTLGLEEFRHAAELEQLHGEVAVRDEAARWLHSEIAVRDAEIQRLRAELAAAGVPADRGERV